MQNSRVSLPTNATDQPTAQNDQVTSEVAAQLLFLRSRSSVRNYAARGKLPITTINHKVYVSVQELYAFAIANGRPTERILAYAKENDIALVL
jgi:hypothetical protein